MTSQQNNVLDTLIYFLERYKSSALKSESQSGFEEIVFGQMIGTIKDLREENHRLSKLSKPAVLKGGLNDETD
jgi:hypothetical protein